MHETHREGARDEPGSAEAGEVDASPRAQPTLSRFVTAGGIVQGSPVFGQLLADATERTVSLSSVGESSLRGAAVHALGGAPAPELVREFAPRPAWSAAIRERRAAAAELDSRLRG